MKRKVYRRLLAFLGKQRIQTFVRCLAQSSFAHVRRARQRSSALPFCVHTLLKLEPHLPEGP